MKTDDESYTERLAKKSLLKRFFDVQMPYRRHLLSLKLGYILDVGCGIGRNLINLGGKSSGIGVDHNSKSISVAKDKGLDVYTLDEFKNLDKRNFDSMLVAHVIEHMTLPDAIDLVSQYLPYIKSGGKVVIITPQEAGYKSDPTHVTMMDFEKVKFVLEKNNLNVLKQYSFPFVRPVGYFFKYNEFVTIGIKN